MLKIGDTVLWKGAFGTQAPKKAKVTGIEVCPTGSKYGNSVDKVKWSIVNGESNKEVVVDLDNGHWARGSALSKNN